MGTIQEIKAYIEKNLTDRCMVYIGTDSKRYRRNDVWYANFVTAVVIHKESKYGCKVFILESSERDFDSKKNRPINRMMMEVYKTSEVYDQLRDLLDGKNVEIHLDINPDENYGSHCALSQAVGYIKGVCGILPKVKPLALAASFAADHHLQKGEYYAILDNLKERNMSRTYRRRRWRQLWRSDQPLMVQFVSKDEIVWEDVGHICYSCDYGWNTNFHYNVEYKANSKTGQVARRSEK